MPDAPAPIPVLSSTTIRVPPPFTDRPTDLPFARSRDARCIAVDNP
jgi:hypothetical protein